MRAGSTSRLDVPRPRDGEERGVRALRARQGSVFDHVEVFFNQRRRHSTLGQSSPAELERRAAQAAQSNRLPNRTKPKSTETARSEGLDVMGSAPCPGWLRERDAPEQTAEPGWLVSVNDKSGFMNQRSQPSIDVGEKRSRYEVHEPSRIRGLLLLAQEFVEYRDTSA